MSSSPRRFLLVLAALVVTAATAALAVGDGKATLRVSILDAASGDRTPVRVRITDESGQAVSAPAQAIGIMYGMWDHADGYLYQPDSAFYVDGFFEIELEPGTYVLSFSKGNEFLAVRDTLHLPDDLGHEVRLERWIDTAAMGWYSADDHIHIRRSPREDPLLMDWIRAEDIHVGNLLRMGDFWAKYYSQYAFGREGAYVDGGYMLVSGQEDPRTPEIGHVIGLGASKFVRFPDRYYLYDLVFDSLRSLGGVGGFAHQAASFHGYRGLTLDGLRGKIDVLEVVQFCVPGGPLITEHLYFLLNLGLPVTATAGSDFPWCGRPHDVGAEMPVHERAQIGNARFYTHVEGPLSYDSWMEGLRAGRTFASSGPVLLLDVEGQLPGSVLEVAQGDELTIGATALGHAGQVPLDRLELVVHGEVIATVHSGDPGQSNDRLESRLVLPVDHGLWIAARAFGSATHDGRSMHVAHTTPVYVTVGDGGFHAPAVMDSLLGRSEQYLSDLEHVLQGPHDHVEHQAWRYREPLLERIAATRAIIERMRRR